MLEDIRKEIEETIERLHRYDYDGLPLQPIEKKYLVHVVPMLSLIDKYREEMNIMTFKYNGAFQRCEEVLQMLFTMDEENKKYKEENEVLRKVFEDLENVVNRVDEEMKPSE